MLQEFVVGAFENIAVSCWKAAISAYVYCDRALLDVLLNSYSSMVCRAVMLICGYTAGMRAPAETM
jgi:hypothetical protein